MGTHPAITQEQLDAINDLVEGFGGGGNHTPEARIRALEEIKRVAAKDAVSDLPTEVMLGSLYAAVFSLAHIVADMNREAAA